MAKEIARQSREVAPPTDRNWAEEYGDEGFQTNITGLLLKFVKGEWIAGKEMTEVPLGTKLVAAVHVLESGWTKWEDSKPVQTLIGMRSEGFRPAPRDALGDLDKTKWPDLNGQPMDPWQLTDRLLLADPKTGQIYTYMPPSKGGKDAIKALCKVYGPHSRTHPKQIPLIQLGMTWYPHAKFGKIYTPILEVVDDGWRDFDDVSFDAPEEEEEKTNGKAKAKAPAAKKSGRR